MSKQTFGTDEEGFDVSTGDGARTVHVRAWGFWSADVAARFSGVVIGACASALVPVVYVFGDIAYTTSAFVASPAWGGAKLNCTNVLQRIDGIWKVIHHHPDRAPSMEASMEKMVHG